MLNELGVSDQVQLSSDSIDNNHTSVQWIKKLNRWCHQSSSHSRIFRSVNASVNRLEVKVGRCRIY